MKMDFLVFLQIKALLAEKKLCQVSIATNKLIYQESLKESHS